MVPLRLRVGHALCVSFLISSARTQSQPGLIAQFLNFECTDKSLVNPSVSLPLDTCLVTTGAIGVVPQRLPACSTGNATLQVYQDQACAQPDSDPSNRENNCFLYGNFVIPAVMFTCSGSPEATSTSTVTAGSVLVPVAKATGATTTSTSGGASSHTTTTDANGVVSSAAPTSSASDPSQTDASSGGSGSGGGDSSSSGLAARNVIALGIALPIGSLVVALLAWLLPKPWNRARDPERQHHYGLLEHPVHHMPHWHRG